jgi:RNA polymerase sigma-70 factor, ECF subfamily
VSETELISRARKGDEAAYTALVELHQEAVFRLAYLLLGDSGDADDVAQETFIHAFRALHRFDTSRPLRPWLLRITTNLARNRWRSISRYVAMIQRMGRSDSEMIERTAKDESAHWDAQALREAVGKLDRADQEVIYLRFFLDMTVDETADVLKIPAGTVKSRLHRALGRLRSLVDYEFPQLRKESGDE